MSKILIIDDEGWLREMIRLALTQRGYEVIEAAGSQDGVEIARQELPDLILCDVNMDKAGAGYNALTKLREDPATATIPFILMTGLADAAGMRYGMALGADDYLPKPFKIDELYAAVEARLRQARNVREIAERKFSDLRNQITLILPHEMHAPFNDIITNAEKLTNNVGTLKPADIVGIGRDISESSHRLERLIENFLIYAQLEIVAADAHSVGSLRAAKTDHAEDIVRSSATQSADRSGRLPDLKVQVADAPVAMAEPYFKKIVTELVQNAFKFSDSSSPVQVKLASVGEEIELSVRDQGPGFSTENIRRVDALVQFERKMQDREGLGLGLAIAKRLVELHGGRLTIDAQKGAGSTVTIRLPQAKAA
jgi:signal transduction histidine kinase